MNVKEDLVWRQEFMALSNEADWVIHELSQSLAGDSKQDTQEALSSAVRELSVIFKTMRRMGKSRSRELCRIREEQEAALDNYIRYCRNSIKMLDELSVLESGISAGTRRWDEAKRSVLCLGSRS